MAAPRQMTANTLNALKGWPQPAAVDFHTNFSTTALAWAASAYGGGRIQAGSVVHLNAAGEYDLGVGTDKVMPLFLFNGSDDPDVQNEGGNAATEKGVFIAISPTGQAMALPAVGAYELVSTAFKSGNYAINDPLTSDKTADYAGLLKVGTMYTDMIVGIVSRGVVNNGYGHDAVAFWPFPVFPHA